MTLKTQITNEGTRYVEGPTCHLIARTTTSLSSQVFEDLEEIDPEFCAVGRDSPYSLEALAPERLLQFSGQLCYLSFGESRTSFQDQAAYLRRIMEQKHGSVLEHANASFLFLGVSRAMTHELVRHRAGAAYSQVSQRYVGSKHLRFVLPYEDSQNLELREQFYKDIDANAAQYRARIELLKKHFPPLAQETNTEYRKRIQSSARSVLGNYAEAPIVMTANYRTWLHVLTMRTGPYADVNIRRAMIQVLEELTRHSPAVFDHFESIEMADGSMAAEPIYEKP